tara:strand:- start:143 stop:517 length:375 start_codon:yes stop_codon:yes gene_type:complete
MAGDYPAPNDPTTHIDVWYDVLYTLSYDGGNHKPKVGDHAWWVLKDLGDCGDNQTAADNASADNRGGKLLGTPPSNSIQISHAHTHTQTGEHPNFVLCLREEINGVTANVMHAHISMGVYHFPP